MLAGIIQRAELVALIVLKTGVIQQQFGKAQNAIQRRAQFMRHACQELAFGFPGGARSVTRCGQFLHGTLQRRDIRADANHATIRCAAFRDQHPAAIGQKPFHRRVIATVKGLALSHEGRH